MINKVRERLNNKIINLKNNNDPNTTKILNLIDSLLQDDYCFIKININLALNILLFLGYEKEESKIIYGELVKECQQKIQEQKYKIIDQSK